MRIEDYTAKLEAHDDAELETILQRRHGHDVNEFWLFPTDVKFPALSIVVNGQLSSLTYFPNDTHPGFVSIGHIDGLPDDQSTMFYINTPTERHEVSNGNIVPLRVAEQAARELLHRAELPRNVQWFEL